MILDRKTLVYLGVQDRTSAFSTIEVWSICFLKIKASLVFNEELENKWTSKWSTFPDLESYQGSEKPQLFGPSDILVDLNLKAQRFLF